MGWIARLAPMGLAIVLGLAPLTAAADLPIEQSLALALSAERDAMRRVSPRVVTRATSPLDSPEMLLRYDPSYLRTLPRSGDQQVQCLAEAIYHEARGEDVMGQFAVAEVILNRVDLPNYPDTVCGVVHQNAHRSNACQFSYACNGRSRAMSDTDARRLAEGIAQILLSGSPRELTDGATHFHTTDVRPRWSSTFQRTAQIGTHLFYREPLRLSFN